MPNILVEFLRGINVWCVELKVCNIFESQLTGVGWVPRGVSRPTTQGVAGPEGLL